MDVVLSGYLISATSYRWMCVIEGLPAIAWAFVFGALSADHPRDAKWLAAGSTELLGGAFRARGHPDARQLVRVRPRSPAPAPVRLAVSDRGAIAFHLSYRVGSGHFVESFVLLIIAGGVMYAPCGPYFAFIPEFMPRTCRARRWR